MKEELESTNKAQEKLVLSLLAYVSRNLMRPTRKDANLRQSQWLDGTEERCRTIQQYKRHTDK
eukprot:12532609-Ditylum_brightwellii.AAC.1